MFANLKIRTQLFAGNGLVLALMVVIALVVYFNVNSLLQTFGWVDHTHKVLEKAMAIEAAAVDMETGMRGYLLAGKEDFLAPYKNGSEKFQVDVAELSNTVSDNPAQVTLLAEIKANIDQWQQNVTEPTIELRRQIGDAKTMNDMAALVQEARGKQYFDKFRGQIATFIEREDVLLKQRQEKAEASYDVAEIRQLTKWVTHTYKVIGSAKSILAAAIDMETGMRGFLLAGNDAFLAPYTQGKNIFFQLIDELSTTVSDNPPQVALLGEIKSTINDWVNKVVEEQIALRREIGDAKTMDDMADLVAEARGKVYFDKFRHQIKTFKEREESLMGVRAAALGSTSDTTIAVTIGGTLMALIAGIGIVVFLTRSITRPVGTVVGMITEMEKGHLGLRTNLNRKDEIGVMAKKMDAFADSLQKEVVDNLQKLASGDLTFSVTPRDDHDLLRGTIKTLGEDLSQIVGQIQASSEQIASGAGQVSDSSQSLSQGATESAASLEEITSSMGEMANQTAQNAENANQANKLANTTQAAAGKGNSQMQEMVSAMGEINEAGQNISKIIKTIDEIAFQTNLLALNAAVEAARAGQHGKGFAVVAEEVRNLAARSAKAASETAQLIEGSVAKTERGTLIADQTAEALQEIVGGIGKVNDLVSEIAVASSEQAQGISEVNQGLAQIDSVTQQNTANAEEGAAASEELSGQAEQMQQLLSQFTINKGNSGMPLTIAKKRATEKTTSWGAMETPTVNGGNAQIALDDTEFGRF